MPSNLINKNTPFLSNFKKLSHIFWLESNRYIFNNKFAAEFNVTDRCNLRCAHCYNLQSDSKVNTDVSLDVWERRFNDLYDSGIRLVQLMGGEPTLRMDVIEKAVETFPFVYVSTNGLIKIPDEWDLKIILSIDGMREVNDKIRGEGVFDRAMENYRGDGRVMFNMVLTMDNYHDLEPLVLLAKRSNFCGVLCNLFTTTEDNRDRRIQGEDRQKLIDELRRVRSLHPETLLMNEIMIEWFEEADHRERCHWREHIYHYNVDWSSRVCYLDKPDCSECGCMAGAMQQPFKMVRYLPDLIKIVTTKRSE